MSKYKKDSPKAAENNWITPTVIVAVIGLIGTLATLYFGYLQSIRPLELAATQTAEARITNPTVTLAAPIPTPTQGLPTVTATFPPPTAIPTSTQVPVSATFTPTFAPTQTLAPTGLKFCINSRNINVRSGPGTEFGVIGSLSFEDCPYFDGRNPDGAPEAWLHLSPGQDQYQQLNGGWVRADLVRPLDFSQLPLIEPPTPTPTPEG